MDPIAMTITGFVIVVLIQVSTFIFSYRADQRAAAQQFTEPIQAVDQRITNHIAASEKRTSARLQEHAAETKKIEEKFHDQMIRLARDYKADLERLDDKRSEQVATLHREIDQVRQDTTYIRAQLDHHRNNAS